MLAATPSGSFAVDALELGAVRERLASHTSFSAGRALALALAPTSNFDAANRAQAITRDAVALPGLRPSLHLGGVHDVRPALDRARIGSVLRPEELLDVASTVRAARAWRRALHDLADELPALAELAYVYLHDHSGLAEDVQAALSEEGEVLDAASPALARIRRELRGAHDRLVTRLRDLMAAAPFRDVVQDPVVTERAGRYVIPIRADARGQVPAIVHDQSASGATLFVEPLAVVEMANRWRTLQIEEEHEIERILRALSRSVGDQADELSSTVEGLAELDLAQAKARLSADMRAVEPRLAWVPRPPGEPVLRLLDARHPLLGAGVVPISLELGVDFDVLLLTGPNTGGKTVALKTAGLLTLMAQSGLQIPAGEGSLVAVFERVQADIGDEQSIQQSLSTFSSHVTRIVGTLDTADSRSLVLLDELGAGTDPQEGAALARAVLGHLQERGAYVIATTHYPELKVYAHVTPRVENASVEFDVETLSPTYRLLVGTPGRSNALVIAERLGMPRHILEAAQANVAPRTAEVESMLAEIAAERHAAEAARQRAERDAAEAADLRARARAHQRETERQRRTVLAEAQSQADGALRELRREALRLRQELDRRGDRGREAIAAALGLAAPRLEPPAPEPAPEEEALPARVQPGAEVLVPRLGVPGRILAIRDGQVELDVLGRRVRLPLEDLREATAAPSRSTPAPLPRVAVAGPQGDVSLQLDLRGLRRDEAIERLEQYLEDASLAGLPSARIVHGKGTGAIRQAVREALRSSPHVSRFAPEPDAAGGDGATTVWIQ